MHPTATTSLSKLTGGVINAVLNWEVVLMMIQDSRLNKTVFVVILFGFV